MDEFELQISSKVPETTDQTQRQTSLESLSRSVERAEERIRSLELENNQLRQERTKAVLEAARAKEAGREGLAHVSDEAKQRFTGLTNGMKIAEAARNDAARERKSAIRAVEEALRQEYTQRIKAIQQEHGAELAALSRTSEQRAREEVANQLDTLTREIADAREALRTAKRHHEEALRKTEDSLVEKYSRQLDELDRTYAQNLEKLSQLNREKFAEELSSSLSLAHASWREKTEQRVEQAKREAENAAAREVARYQRHSRSVLRRAARAWRVRERRRLANARSEWQSAHRRALDDCNNRWRIKFDRLKRYARRSWWRADHWRLPVANILNVLPPRVPSVGEKMPIHNSGMPSPAHGGIMAAILIFLGINFPVMGTLPATEQGFGPIAPSAQTAQQKEIAALPRHGARDYPATTPKPSGHTPPDQPKATLPDDTTRPANVRFGGNPDGQFPKAVKQRERFQYPHATTGSVGPSAGPDATDAAAPLTDEMLRERLQRSIRDLRNGQPGN